MAEGPLNQTRQTASSSQKAAESTSSGTTRVDPAHPLGDAVVSEREGGPLELAAVEPGSQTAVAEQLRAQANQLAGHLRKQQRELDRREAQQHAQLAQMEGEVRKARMLLFEREHRVAELENLQQERARDIEQRAADLSATELAWSNDLQSLQEKFDGSEREYKERHDALDRKEKNLNERQVKMDRMEDKVNSDKEKVLRIVQELNERHMLVSQRKQEQDALQERQQRQEKELNERHVELNRREHQQQELQAEVKKQQQEMQAKIEQQQKEHQARLAKLQRDMAQLAARDEELCSKSNALIAAQQQWSVERAAQRQQLRRLMQNQEQNRKALEEQSQRAGRVVVRDEKRLQWDAVKEQMEQREKHLAEAESLIREQTKQIAAQQSQLEEGRRRVEKETRLKRRELAQEQRRRERELREKKEEVMRRSEGLQKRESALEQMQADVTRLHRESLELRFVTEELWAQLSGKVSPAALTQSLGKTRSRLNDYYRSANATLAQQKDEIQVLVGRLSDQQDKLKRQRTELENWVTRRHEDIEQQAARLVAREQELDRQQRHYESSQQSWQDDRRKLQGRIRLLLAQLRRNEVAVA